MNVRTNTELRISSYGKFDEDIVESVGNIAERHHKARSYIEYAANSGVPEPTIFSSDGIRPIEVIRFLPKSDYDERRAKVIYNPHGSGLTPNKIVRADAIFQADPTEQIIMFGNPGIRYVAERRLLHLRQLFAGKNNLHLSDLSSVRMGDLRAATEPMFRYLHAQNIQQSTQIGPSYGAERAAAACHLASDYDHEVSDGILIEPVAVKSRSLIELLKDFQSTEEAYKAYVADADTDLLVDSRDRSETALTYVLALLKASNLAIAGALRRPDFEDRTNSGLELHPELTVDIMWGSESEMAIDGLMGAIVARLKEKHGPRVRSKRLEGHKHGMADDIYFNAALILQSHRNAKPHFTN